MATIVTLDPVTRLEGHLKVEVTIDAGYVTDARASGTLFRGFESILVNRSPWLESVPRVLAIDAMDAGGPPGTIYSCKASEVAGAVRSVSLHELGLLAVLEFVPEARRPEITVLGVQPAVVDYGLELSPALERALPRVLEAVQTIAGCFFEAKTVSPG